MTIRERTYWTMTLAATGALAGWALRVSGEWYPDPVYTVLLSLLALFASRWKVVIPRLQGNLSGGFLFTIYAVFQLSLQEALFVGFLAVLAQTWWNSRTRATVARYVFNVCCVSAAVVSTKLAHDSLRLVLAPEMALLNGILCGAVYFAVNTGVLSGMLAVSKGKSFAGLWRESFFWSMPLYAVGGGVMGVLASLSAVMGRGATLLIGPVVLLVHRYYSMKVDAMEESQRRLELANEHIREMSEVHVRTVEALALAIGAKDEVTGDHLNRVRIYCRNLGTMMGLSELEMQALDAAALLHDIGKLAVPEHILKKPGRLTAEEFESIKMHPQIGAEILERVRFPYPVVPIVRSHHEQWAGGGYPDGLRGEAIPIGARILTVVDCFDALASDRQYRKALPVDEVMGMIEADAGVRYDPAVVAHLKANYVVWEKQAREAVSNLNLVDVAPVQVAVAPAAGFSQEGGGLSPSVATAISAASAEVQLLLDLSAVMVTSTSVTSLMEQVSARLGVVIPFDGLSVYDTSGVHAERIFAGGSATEPGAMERERERVDAVLRSGEPVTAAGDGEGSGWFCALPLKGSGGEMPGVWLFRAAKGKRFTRDHIRILTTMGTQLGMTVQLLRMFASMVTESRIDVLTGVGNRREFEERTMVDVDASLRNGEPFSILCVDIDDFKVINDRFGHAAGDAMLCWVAGILRDCCQPMDYVCRIGGDEFVLALPGAEAQRLEGYRARIGELLRERRQSHGYAGAAIQLSIGGASLGPEIRTREQLLAAADADMYAYKRQRKSLETVA